MIVKSAAAIAKKWARVTPGRDQDYEDGIRNPSAVYPEPHRQHLTNYIPFHCHFLQKHLLSEDREHAPTGPDENEDDFPTDHQHGNNPRLFSR